MTPDARQLNFTPKVKSIDDCDYPALMVGVFKGLKKPTGVLKHISRLTEIPSQALIDVGEIRGTFKEFTLIHQKDRPPFRRVLVMGLGPREEYCPDRIRSIVARAVRTLRKIGCPKMAVVPSDFPGSLETTVEAITEGTILGLYKFTKYLDSNSLPSKRPFNEVMILLDSKKDLPAARSAVNLGRILGFSTNFARDLGNEPANIITPVTLAGAARELAKRNKLKIRIFKEAQLKKMEMGGILAVGAAGKHPPCLIELRYEGGGSSKATVALVGKGVTFDSGGVSIKSHAGMHHMKTDMCGAAAVLGVMEAIARLKLPINVIALVPSAENLLDRNGYKPSDIIKLCNGKKVEIIDTDAEGRLLLGDALAYASARGVDCIVDVATLTGGVIRALGYVGTGIMGNNRWLLDHITAAGKTCAEKMWQLPLWEEFSVHLKSTVATIANCHQSPIASSSTAGMFLKEFVDETPWVHLDIAGTASIDEDTTIYYHKPYLPKRGATGVAVRTLVRFLQRLLQETKGRKSKMATALRAGRSRDD